MTKKANKKGKKGNVKRRPFRLLELPTKLIEEVCEILKAQNRQKSLATLNVANKHLRDVTSRYPWESVRWTPRSWNPELYCVGKLPTVFKHVKYVMLVSPDEGSDGNDNGWDHYDGLFWTPLLIRPGSAFRNKTFGQLAHLCFPNLKYVVCLSAPPAKAKQSKTPKAWAYVSDQNLIAKRDTAAVRKMIFDTLWEIRHGKNVPRSFTDIVSPPVFRADRVNFPDYDTILTAVNNLIANAAMPGAQHFVEPEYRVIGGFDPFRNVASILVDGVTLILNLMTTVNPEAMRSKIRGKVLDLFSLTRRLVAEDHAIYKKTRFQLALDIDFSLNRIPVGIRFFDRVTKWIDDLSRHPLLPCEHDVTDPPFDLYVRMPEQFTMSQLKTSALAFHTVMTKLHAESPVGISPRLPVSVVIHGYLNVRRPINSIFTIMDFTTPDLAKVVCFGTYHGNTATYQVTDYYQNGEEVLDDGLCTRLERLFTR